MEGHSFGSRPMRPALPRSRAFRQGPIFDRAGIGTVSARSADHYRAIPLSDGYHILFTDPRTGCLCLGTDAPVGSITRLVRKVWLRPPSKALTVIPILYAAGSDMRHGVRVVATFAATEQAANDVNRQKQVIVFFSIPPDLFCGSLDVTTEPATGLGVHEAAKKNKRSESRPVQGICQASDLKNSLSFPYEVRGQPIALWENLTEIALDSSPEMIVWAFSSSGWARAWALDCGQTEPLTRTVVQEKGGICRVDHDGDVLMIDNMTSAVSDDCCTPGSLRSINPFDGTVGNNFVEHRSRSEGATWCRRIRGTDKMSGTASVDRLEGGNGVVRLDVQLR